MKTKTQWIKVTGESEPVAPEKGRCFSLEELQRYVGGYIELVRLAGDMLLVVNDCGRMFNMPFNMKASLIAGQEIAGDAVLCRRNQVK